MSAVDDAIAELDAALLVLGPQHEGLKDYARLNVKPETLVAVNAALVIYDKRAQLLTDSRGVLVKLRNHGYPTIDLQQVTAAVFADLQENQATIAAALARFASDPAQRLGLSAQAPEEK